MTTETDPVSGALDMARSSTPSAATGADSAQPEAAPAGGGQSAAGAARSARSWAQPVDRLKTQGTPDDAFAANLDGRHVVSPLQGFGQLWQRTYRVRLTGVTAAPADVMATWKANFPQFQPPENRFYPSRSGVQPGEMVYIDSSLMQGPGVSQITEMASGVMIIYSDDVSFTVMTPEGFPVSGWNTFSAFDDDGCVVAQVQGLERATDPIYEFGYRFLGGERKQDMTWTHVLRSLAAHHGVIADVQSWKTCVDPKVQWGNAGNVWHNAAIRTFLYRLAAPLRWLRGGKPAAGPST
jgi:hypothetical protein